MNPFSRWFLGIIFVWALPAYVAWYGFAQYDLLTRERLGEELFERQKHLLEERCIALDPDEFLRTAARHLLDRLAETPSESKLARARHAEIAATWARGFPSGFLEWYLFDASATVWLASGSIKPVGREDIIRCLRMKGTRPYLDPFPQDLHNSWPHAGHVLPRLWNRENMPVLLHALEGGSEGAFRGFWSEPASHAAGIGVFLIAREQAMSRDQRLRWLCDHSPPGSYSGSYRADRPPDGYLPPDHSDFVRFLQQQIELGRERAVHQGLQTTFVWVDREQALWVAQPQPESGLPWRAIPAAYVLISFFILSQSYRRIVLDHRQPMRLSLKLYGLFGLILVFPLAGVCLLGAFLVEEKRSELVQEFRRESLDRLRQIDTVYTQFLSRYCQVYRRRIRQLEAFRHDQLRLSQQLAKWFDEGGFDNHYLVSSASVFLAFEFNTHRALRRRLSRLAEPERHEVFLGWIKAGFFPGRDDLRRLRGEPVPDRFSNDKEDMIKQALARMTVSAIEQQNRDAGIETGPSNSDSVKALDVMIGDSNFEMVKVLRQKSEGFFYAGSELDGNYYLFDIIRGPDGSGWYGILLGAEVGTIQKYYLSSLSAHLSRKGGPVTYRFISTTDPYSPYYPDYDHAETYQFLTNRLLRRRHNVLYRRLSLDGHDVEVTGMSGAKLMKYTLFATIRVSEMEHRVATFRRMIITRLTAAFLIASLLAWIMLRLLLRPVRELERGLENIRSRRYNALIQVYGEDELGQLCHAFNRAMLHLGEMEVAAVVQKRLLPQQPLHQGDFEWRGMNIMTQAVGGDYFDFLSISSRQVAFTLGDVSGHGVSAALVTAMAKAGFSILCPLFPDDPARVLNLINQIFVEVLNRRKMMTMFLGVLDVETGTAVYANAGQCYPIEFTPGSPETYLRVDSRPLGITRKGSAENNSISSFPHACLLYSDGIVEAQTRDGEMVGYDRFLMLAGAALKQTTADPLETLRASIASQLTDRGFDDDVTLLLIRRVSS